DFERFRIGLEDFLEVEDPGEGLGPVFNGRSCAECHSIPAIGGGGSITEIRAGRRNPDGSFDPLPGGSLFQLFSIPPHNCQESIPPEANVVAARKAIPLFGAGLVEAIPDETLSGLADPDDRDGDGVSGRVHWVLDVGTQTIRAGRFGWKAQQATLLTFGAEAYLEEMGITNELFPLENAPNGDAERLRFCDPTRALEDVPDLSTGLRGIDNFEAFLRFLAPPPRGEITDTARQGEQVFARTGCDACHVPVLFTGPARIRSSTGVSCRFIPIFCCTTSEPATASRKAMPWARRFVRPPYGDCASAGGCCTTAAPPQSPTPSFGTETKRLSPANSSWPCPRRKRRCCWPFCNLYEKTLF
ncbi:MAG: hypothetical protein O7E51_07405, partial [Acidobacteria bacterium]|nr:hypothetical protein [Acidobacteriota bacterium]